ncbi:uncharacterized protein KY384_007644 [Bacidia gigantensis]|uniref:uncharacterized protein n=1 Tax=Bacidia gigantensis TaxID=2732470 RepID=UPI001D04AC41|nr:uncharacterized protein KY384_007644 [Bacidia gigantensis]KAG8527492.1 hypothetical protein KY384_007644 [Bacidia gigantensis]
MATIVLGSQFGDEGKGKLVDILCREAHVCARCAGGNNAGHTIVANGVTYDFHILPSGLVNPLCKNLIGTGCVVHIPSFFKELETLKAKGLNTQDRIYISDRAHITFDLHTVVDGLEEQELGTAAVGTTKKGIGPTYSCKAARSNARVTDIFHKDLLDKKLRHLAESAQKRYGDLFTAQNYDLEGEIARFDEYRVQLQDFVIDAAPFISEMSSETNLLVEGANALMLDIDWGTYPMVTSSSTGIAGAMAGLALSPDQMRQRLGVMKSYTTRVGNGPLPTEQLNEDGVRLQKLGREFGVTTGRPRRCGWLDLVIVKYSKSINHYTALNLTKLDVLDTFPEIKVATKYKVDSQEFESFPADLELLERAEVVYETLPGWMSSTTGITTWEQLPENAKKYITFIEDYLGGLKCKYIGTGPDREHMIFR